MSFAERNFSAFCMALIERISAPRAASSGSQTLLHPAPALRYRMRLANCPADIKAAQRLRFEVFNRELEEGLLESWNLELDQDRFDSGCDHLLVELADTGMIVGTYRLQTGDMAAANHGFYSAQEFDFDRFEPYRGEIVELGRACVDIEHRKMSVINMLWRGIAEYANQRKARYLLGCSSLTSQNEALGSAMYARLATEFLAAENFRTNPLPAFRCDDVTPLAECPPPPRLLRAYLSIGARVCGPPAIDREFKTIDFLTLVDLRSLPAAVQHYFNV